MNRRALPLLAALIGLCMTLTASAQAASRAPGTAAGQGIPANPPDGGIPTVEGEAAAFSFQMRASSDAGAMVAAGETFNVVDGPSEQETSRIQVTPAMMPPSQTRLSFDKVECPAGFPSMANVEREDYGAHSEIIWDPLERAPLARDVFLTRGCWQVSLSATPIPHAIHPYVDLSWSRFKLINGAPTSKNPRDMVLCAYRQAGGAPDELGMPYEEFAKANKLPPANGNCRPNDNWMAIPIQIRLISPTHVSSLLETFGEKGEHYTPLPSANRAFGVTPTTLADDALQAVADLAVEHAEARILESVNDLLIERLCGESTAGQIQKALAEKGVEGFSPFSHTCTALRRVRLRDLTTASKNLQQALLSDGLELASLMARMPLQSTCTRAVSKDCYRLASSLASRSTPPEMMLRAAFANLGPLLAATIVEQRGAALGNAQVIVRQVTKAVQEKLKLEEKRTPVELLNALKELRAKLQGLPAGGPPSTVQASLDRLDRALVAFDTDLAAVLPLAPSDVVRDLTALRQTLQQLRSDLATAQDLQAIQNAFAPVDARLAEKAFKQVLTTNSELAGAPCELVGAMSALAFCHANGRCDTHLIRQLLESPERYFDLPPVCLAKINDHTRTFQEHEAALANIVTEGLAVMSPKTQADTDEVMRHSMAFMRYSMDFWYVAFCPVNLQGDAEACQKQRKDLEAFFKLADAIVEKDVPIAINASGAVLASMLGSDRDLSLERGMRYASAMASYAGTYASSQQDAAKGREEQRLARKQALQSLMDLSSDRSTRKGEYLVSLSVAAGLRPSVMLTSGPGPDTSEFGFHPSLPLGIALTKQFEEQRKWGFFSQVYALDVGQYALVASAPTDDSAHTRATPYSAIAVGSHVGVSYRDLVFAIDARLTPSLQTEATGNSTERWKTPFSAGIFLGYHLPLITFN